MSCDPNNKKDDCPLCVPREHVPLYAIYTDYMWVLMVEWHFSGHAGARPFEHDSAAPV